MTLLLPHGTRPPARVVIDRVTPEVDGGRHAAKSSIGERFEVTAHAYADGHDLLQGSLLYRAARGEWCEAPLAELGNDEWSAAFKPTEIGPHSYTVVAWIDRYGSWLQDLEKRIAAGWDVTAELQEGAGLLREMADRAPDEERLSILVAATWLEDGDVSIDRRLSIARDPALRAQARRYRNREDETTYRYVLPLWVDRERARFSTWYEMFPRSVTPDPERGGTLREAASRFPDIAGMGFDVLYLPPVHPIGTTARKGQNNALHATPLDPGSPWAIGSDEGGHTAVHSELGSIEDFEWFVQEASHHGLEVALDLAFQCSPDHPWVSEHPDWFRQRPDGSIRFAENPPKQYQDIYPINFETDDWRSLWLELLRVTTFWIDRGVRIFRVDNPHTKPFAFWEWLIATVHESHPDVIFLAEAFTRPKRMLGLAKLGFTQSYSYFTWRNEKRELIDYFTELTRPPAADVMRPNLFANTPDILHEYLQQGGRPAFMIRAVLAATLGPSYGIYSGFELIEREAVAEGSEEYRDSEKYQLRSRDWDAPGNIKQLIARLNWIRRQHEAFQHNHRLWFLPIENDRVLAYLKASPHGAGPVLTVVNLDPFAAQEGWVGLPLDALGVRPDGPFVMHELLVGRRETWTGEWHHLRLEPDRPAVVYAFEGPATEGLAEGGGILP